ncbi:MAG: hypothetical protein A3K19_23375 [Lentisphaerae bacterium RIFOXYB12_FULL_65_16]|nr:MAG: hypothetical protein A3K18_26330 [Lentisphaerae bacterium RIFOXYA12_64_32]OGV87506.1 MAG: hypothetical protein A3K19_23375 [Lentisphaerae bacterium RIFOXYB12_FULL_65_16]
MRDALLWYEGCETVAGANADKGVKISGVTAVDGKIGKALLFERPYANRVANPDVASLDGWIAVGAPQLCKDGGRFSPGCVRITEADYLRQVVTDLRAQQQDWYCLSVYAKSDAAGTKLELRVDREIAKEFPLTTEYARLVLPFQARHENSTVTVRVVGPGAAVVDAVQLEEQRSFPSTFCPSPRRPTQRIDVAVSERTLNVTEGSIAFWMLPPWIREEGTSQALFFWGDIDNPGVEHLAMAAYPHGMTTEHDWYNRILLSRTRARRHDGFNAKSFDLCNWEPGAWHHVVATWTVASGEALSQIAVYFDGRLTQTKEGPWGEVKAPKSFIFGYWWGSYADAVLDEICVFRRALSAEEVEWLAKLQAPLAPAAAR